MCVSNMHCRIPKMSTGSNGYTSCDKVGQWPTEDDTEIPSRVSGYERLHNGRFNKVSELDTSKESDNGICYLQPAVGSAVAIYIATSRIKVIKSL